MNYRTGQRLKCAFLIGMNGFKTNLAGWSLYIFTTVTVLASSLIILSYHGSIKEDGLLVTGSPLNFPFYLGVVVTGIYLSAAALISVARERESGTMEVLFYGPVDSVSYVAGKFLENLLSFVVIAVGFLTIFLILGTASNFGYFSHLVPRILLAFSYSASLVAIGIVIAITMNSVRTAILALAGLLLGLTAVQGGKLLIFEGVGGKILTMLSRVSPFYFFDRGLQALADLDWTGYLFFLGLLIGLTFMAALGSIIILARKGVKQK